MTLHWHCDNEKSSVLVVRKSCSKSHNPWICLSLRLRQFYMSLSASKFHCFDFLGKTCENATGFVNDAFSRIFSILCLNMWIMKLTLSRFSKTFSMFMYQRSSKEEPLKSYNASTNMSKFQSFLTKFVKNVDWQNRTKLVLLWFFWFQLTVQS